MSDEANGVSGLIRPGQLLGHWQGHRRVTRRVIEAFPEEKLLDFSIGGMRPFAELAGEMLAMEGPMVEELASGEAREYKEPSITSRTQLLRLWDESTASIEENLPKIPLARYQETRTVFGQYTAPVYDLLLYGIDNEVHHRGQGYVYLRALGIEPPPFYVRD